MKVLLITPPMLQCNTPYSATPLLTAHLRQEGVDAVQVDASLELLLRLFSGSGLARVHEAVTGRTSPGAAGRHFLGAYERYAAAIDPVIRFLQGKDPTLSHRIVSGDLLPQGPRFDVMRDQETDADGTLAWAFGTLGTGDHAQYLASLFIDDLAHVIREDVDPAFGLSRYEEKLGMALPSLDPLLARLDGPPTLVDGLIDEIAADLLARNAPGFVGITVPFPGCLYGALRLARAFRRRVPGLPIALGGGYVNTELRELRDIRLFDLVSYVCLDVGPDTLLAAVRHAAGATEDASLVRTFVCREGQVVLLDSQTATAAAPRHDDLPAPVFDGLPRREYVALVEMLNPMHALWSNGRWNRIMLAHGCYWHRCRFCDTTLDYIRSYDPASPRRLADWIQRIVDETGETGFHFVDEAAPPAVLRGLAEELLRRRLVVSWWGNIRLEKTFDEGLVDLLVASGCIAVTGGIEAASERLLQLIDKGVTFAQAVRVCDTFARAGVLVHGYLMYGLPTQTAQETIDSLERVRQLFAAECLHSAYWHRFSATAHSDIGRHPGNYGIELCPVPAATFARNELPFRDPSGVDHESLGAGLRKAVYNYMHGMALEEDVRVWFPEPVPKPKVPPREIERAIQSQA